MGWGGTIRDTQDLGGGADVGALRFIVFLNHGDVAVAGSLIDFSVLCSRAVQNFIAWREAFRSARLPGIPCNPSSSLPKKFNRLRISTDEISNVTAMDVKRFLFLTRRTSLLLISKN